MDYRTFQAPTMSAALAVVKQELGPTAVILQTRSFTKNRWLGLRRQEVFEITAGRGGQITAENIPGGGARVSVVLPAIAERRTELRRERA